MMLASFSSLYLSIAVCFMWCGGQSSLVTSSAVVVKTITVDINNSGDFTKIQDAIDAVPPNNAQWVRILVKEGTYREKVIIPDNKGFILLEGQGDTQPVIAWGDHAIVNWTSWNSANLTSQPSPTMLSATFTVLASNFVAKWINFQNTYNLHKEVPIKQAAAVVVAGDKVSFYLCIFDSYQDTLCDFLGRHYFDHCVIQGCIDFIFGFGKSIYQSCEIRTKADMTNIGWLTANGRGSADDPSGFVFKNCILSGNGKTWLGRAWKAFSRVIFYHTIMTNGYIYPKGWDPYTALGMESQTTFAEYGCSGAGFQPKPPRVDWEKTLNDSEIQEYIDIKFIDTEGWLTQQP